MTNWPYREIENTLLSKEEKAAAEADTDKTLRLWNMFSHMVHNDTIYRGVHPAPAVSDLMTGMMIGNDPFDPIVQVAPAGPKAQQAIFEARMNVLAFADILFQFGQFTAQRGHYYGNLVQCPCNAIRDDDLKAFIAKRQEDNDG